MYTLLKLMLLPYLRQPGRITQYVPYKVKIFLFYTSTVYNVKSSFQTYLMALSFSLSLSLPLSFLLPLLSTYIYIHIYHTVINSRTCYLCVCIWFALISILIIIYIYSIKICIYLRGTCACVLGQTEKRLLFLIRFYSLA